MAGLRPDLSGELKSKIEKPTGTSYLGVAYKAMDGVPRDYAYGDGLSRGEAGTTVIVTYLVDSLTTSPASFHCGGESSELTTKRLIQVQKPSMASPLGMKLTRSSRSFIVFNSIGCPSSFEIAGSEKREKRHTLAAKKSEGI